MNKGLETLGIEEYLGNGETYLGVFEESAVKYVSLPATLKTINRSAFRKCTNLKSVKFPDGLETI